MNRRLPSLGFPALAGSLLLAGCQGTGPRGHVVREWDFSPEATSRLPGTYRAVPTPGEGLTGHAAEAVRTRDGRSLMVQLMVQPPEPVGSPARLRFQCHLEGADSLTVQMFDVTVQDNRHIVLRDVPAGRWLDLNLDFTRDSKRNDGTPDVFPASNPVDDVFFFVPDAAPAARLRVRDVSLYSPSAR